MPKNKGWPPNGPPATKKFLRVLASPSDLTDVLKNVSPLVGGPFSLDSTPATVSHTPSVSSPPSGVVSNQDLLKSLTSGSGPETDLVSPRLEPPQGVVTGDTILVASEDPSVGTQSQPEMVNPATVSDSITPPLIGGAQTPRKWSSFLQESAQLEEIGTPTQHISGAPFVLIPDENIAAAKHEFKDFIFARFHGDSAEMGRIIGVINAIWARSGFPMFVAPWTQDLDPEQPPITSVIIPVELCNVPYLLFNKESLSRISTAVGKPVSLAPETERKENFEVAKVYVRVDLTKTLPLSVISGFSSGKEVEIAISYPWLPLKCDTCGKYGHEKRSCCLPASGRNLSTSPAPKERRLHQSRPSRSTEVKQKSKPRDDGPREAKHTSGSHGSFSEVVSNTSLQAKKRNYLEDASGKSDVDPLGRPKSDGLLTSGNSDKTSSEIQGGSDIESIDPGAPLHAKTPQDPSLSPATGAPSDIGDFPNARSTSASGAIPSPAKDGVSISEEHESLFFMVSRRKSGPENVNLTVTFAYGFNRLEDRLSLWEELWTLNACTSVTSHPWVVVGDFNQIMRVSHHSNHLGLDVDESGMDDLNLALQDAELFEAQSKGLSFTLWNNQDQNPIAKKIDHAFINQPWSLCFPDAYAEFLEPLQSDHAACLFKMSSAQRRIFQACPILEIVKAASEALK
ncbi:unnamed protein product [Thlaspi arvense]|uniref:CCHC-type domain-containing protein n=1 Tax=Thlaspi arvense TaxID=13288 RepID=A0AAU9RQK8_THLAR|nr:unnamed protein product [Thlaspi arvense]